MKANFNDNDNTNGRKLLESSVSLDDIARKVAIKNLVIDGPDLFELLRKCDTDIDRITETRKVIDIGAFVKSKVQMAVDTDYFDRRVSDMTGEFEKGLDTVKAALLETISQKFDPLESGSYTNSIQRFFNEAKGEFGKQIQDSILELSNGKKAICNSINESFDPELKSSHISKFIEGVDKLHATIREDFDFNKAGSITYQMRELIKATLGEDGEFAKSIDKRLSFDNPNSTITILQNNVMKKLDEIKTELISSRTAAEAEQAVLEKSTQKGVSFEDLLEEKLQAPARSHSAVVERTSRTAGEVTRCQKGDFVLEFPALDKTIVVEAKSGKLNSLPELRKEMTASKVNRKADFVIAIYKDETLLNTNVGIFQEYQPDQIVTHLGLLEVAFKIAVSRMQLESYSIDSVDRRAVEREIDSIKTTTKSLGTIKTAANNILKQANDIAGRAEDTKQQITDSLKNLSTLLLDKSTV